MARKYEVEIVAISEIATDVLDIRIRRVDGEPFVFMAGQFLMIHFEHEGALMKRSYSVASVPDPGHPTEELELCIALVPGGIGSALVASWKVGDTVTASGPHGRFILRPGETQDLVLVATGTGIAPYRSMKSELRAAVQQGRRVTLIFGAPVAERLLYDAEWRELAADLDGFEYLACLSRADDVDPAAGQRKGRVQVGLREIDVDVDNTLFYVCGNPDMVEEVMTLLQERGFERRSIRTEAYVSPIPRPL